MDPTSSIGGSGGLRFEVVDQILEVIDEVRVVKVRLVAGEREDLSVAFGRLAMLACGLLEPAETLEAVMYGWDALRHLVGSPLGRFEFPGVDESEHGIGHGIQLFVAVKA